MKNAAFYSDASQPLMNPPQTGQFNANIAKKWSYGTMNNNKFSGGFQPWLAKGLPLAQCRAYKSSLGTRLYTASAAS
jgi:hypothetical protein